MDWTKPHAPTHACPRCWDLFGDWADDTADIDTTDHRTGYDSLVLKRDHPSRVRWLVRARRAAMDRYVRAGGQAIVEMALVLPIMLTLLLAIAEVGILGYTMQRYQDGAQVLAAHSDELDDAAWMSASIALAADVGCDLAPAGVERTPLGAMGTAVRLTCHYHPVAYAALSVPVTVEAMAP